MLSTNLYDNRFEYFACGTKVTDPQLSFVSKVIFVLAKRTHAHLMTNYLSANRNISLMASKHVTNHNSVKPVK